MSSTSKQTPVQITPSSTPPVLASAPPQTVAGAPTITKCPPGQIKDSTGNCVSPSTLVKNLTNATAPQTPPVLAAAPVPTVQTPSAPVSPRSNVKNPKTNTHIQQTAQGGANPPTLTPPPIPSGTPTPSSSTAGGTPPTTPTIPPAQIPPPTPQPPKPIPPTQVPPRQTPIPPPVPHPPIQRPIPRDQRPPGEFDRDFPIRTFQRFPDRFHDFDHRFDDDRRRFDCDDFREEFDDDDDRRFRPFIERAPCINLRLIEHILGIVYDPISSALGRDIPTDRGIWVIGIDGQWYRVAQCENDLIVQIESTRGIDRHNPIIIGGGIGLQSGNRTGGISIQGLAVIGIGLGIIWWLTGGKGGVFKK